MLPSAGTGISPLRRGSAISRSHTMTEGIPSGIVTSRWIVLPDWNSARISPASITFSILYSPGLIGPSGPQKRAWLRRLEAERRLGNGGAWGGERGGKEGESGGGAE